MSNDEIKKHINFKNLSKQIKIVIKRIGIRFERKFFLRRLKL
jgi:hypothetical protein